MLIAGVIDHQLGDDTQAALMGLAQKGLEIVDRAVAGMDSRVIGDVVSVVAQWRGIERQEPDDVDAEVLEVVELAGQSLEVADAVVIAIEERTDVRLIDDLVLVPE